MLAFVEAQRPTQATWPNIIGEIQRRWGVGAGWRVTPQQFGQAVSRLSEKMSDAERDWLRANRKTGGLARLGGSVAKAAGGAVSHVANAATLPGRVVKEGPSAIVKQVKSDAKFAAKAAPVAATIAGTAIGGPLGGMAGNFLGNIASDVAAGKKITAGGLLKRAGSSVVEGGLGVATAGLGTVAAAGARTVANAAIKTGSQVASGKKLSLGGVGKNLLGSATTQAVGLVKGAAAGQLQSLTKGANVSKLVRVKLPGGVSKVLRVKPPTAVASALRKVPASIIVRKATQVSPNLKNQVSLLRNAKAGVRTLLTAGEKTVAQKARTELGAALKRAGGIRSVVQMRPALSAKARQWVISMARSRREAGALVEGGKIYVVEAGDNPTVITRKILNGGKPFADENKRRADLFKANTQYAMNADKTNFKFLPAGRRLNVPASWVTPGAPAPTPAPVVPPATPPAGAPSLPSMPKPAALPAPVMSSEMTADAKAILIAWSATDGRAEAGLTDYGADPKDLAPSWNERDGLMLMSFLRWARSMGEESVLVPAPTSTLTAESFAVLVLWANAHIAAQDATAAEIAKQRAAAGLPATQLPGATAVPKVPGVPTVPTVPALSAPAPVPTVPSSPIPKSPSPTTPRTASAADVLANLSRILYTETNPALLRSAAAQALQQAGSGAYSAADKQKLLEAAKALADRANALEGKAPTPALPAPKPPVKAKPADSDNILEAFAVAGLGLVALLS